MGTSTFGARSGVLVVAALTALVGCGGISTQTKEQIARAETSVMQAQQTVGNSEAGALQLQTARNHLNAAKGAKKDTEASRNAEQARLSAELAVAKAQSAGARNAADELQASIKALRDEAGRPR